MASVSPDSPQGGQERRYTKVSNSPPAKGGRRRKGKKALVSPNGDVVLNRGGGDVLIEVVGERGHETGEFVIDYGYHLETKTISVHIHKPLTPKTVKPTRSTRGTFSFNVESVFNTCEALRPVTRISCDVAKDYDAQSGEPVLAILLGTGVEKRVIKRGPRKKKTEKEKGPGKGGPEATKPPEEPKNQPQESPEGEEKESA